MNNNTQAPYRELKGANQVLYALGHIGPGMLSQFITTWLLLFCTGNADNVVLSGTLVGAATLSGRIIDGIADPLVANWSDNFISKKFGRRLPFMILGTIPMILCFLMLWITPIITVNEIARFFWLFVFLNGFYFFYTVVVNPYFALLPEIASSENQRIFIQSFVSVFGIVGMGISMGASGFLIDAAGYFGAGVILSVVCAVVMVAPALVIRANPDYEYTGKRQSSNLFKNIAGAFSSTKFQKYIIGFGTFYLGFQLTQYNLAFITTVQLGLEKGMSSTLFIVSVVFALLFIPVYNIFVKKLGSTKALMVATGSYAVVAVLILLMPSLKMVSPMVMGIVLMALLGFPYSGLMVIPNVLIGDIVDDDYARNNVRREAMFFGVQGLVNKLMTAFASFLVGVLHDILGNSAANPTGVRVISPLAAVFSIVGLVMFARMNTERKETK